MIYPLIPTLGLKNIAKLGVESTPEEIESYFLKLENLPEEAKIIYIYHVICSSQKPYAKWHRRWLRVLQADYRTRDAFSTANKMTKLLSSTSCGLLKFSIELNEDDLIFIRNLMNSVEYNGDDYKELKEMRRIKSKVENISWNLKYEDFDEFEFAVKEPPTKRVGDE